MFPVNKTHAVSVLLKLLSFVTVVYNFKQEKKAVWDRVKDIKKRKDMRDNLRRIKFCRQEN